MARKRSFIRTVILLMTVQLALLTLLLFFLVWTAMRSARTEMVTVSDNLLEVSVTNLQNRLERADSTLKNIVLDQETNLSQLQSADEAARSYARQQLSNTMHSVLNSDSAVDMLVVAENRYDTCLDAEVRTIGGAQKEALRAFAQQRLDACERSNTWGLARIGGSVFFCRSYQWGSHIVAAFIEAQKCLETNAGTHYDGLALVLSDGAGTAWACTGAPQFAWASGAPLPVPAAGSLVRHRSFADGQAALYSYMSGAAIRGQVKYSSVILILIMAMTTGFSLAVVTYLGRQVIRPMRSMTASLERMQNGSGELQLRENVGSREFLILRDAFNRLMGENISLRLKSYEKQIELQDTELRCIRFQLRPHFFLNAMTTISSLSMQGKNDEIRAYVEALSKNVRYMFKSGLHTVPLQEEVQNVEYYFAMQELKYPDTVFYCIEKEPGTENWRIPQMILHTVVENEYKHAVSVDAMLTLLVSAKRVQRGGEELLCLTVEDDGGGYPDAVLQEYAAADPAGRAPADGTRVGLHSIRRMLELMYERSDLLTLCNIAPHGARTQIFLPRAPVREFRQDAEAAAAPRAAAPAAEDAAASGAGCSGTQPAAPDSAQPGDETGAARR